MTANIGLGGAEQGQPYYFNLQHISKIMNMTTLSPNTVSKLHYFDNRIKSFYEKNGYSNMPFDGKEVQKMIESSQLELNALFYKIWGSTMGYHLLDKFYDFRGNILEFFMSLDPQNKERFTTINW